MPCQPVNIAQLHEMDQIFKKRLVSMSVYVNSRVITSFQSDIAKLTKCSLRPEIRLNTELV